MLSPNTMKELGGPVKVIAIPLLRGVLLFLSVVAVVSLFAPVANALGEAFGGKVVGVDDGDTISVLKDGQAVRVRFAGIDCPEDGQPFSAKAKKFTSTLCFGANVSIEEHGLDKYGRTIGTIVLPDGRNLNQLLVAEGLCWWYRKYAPNDEPLSRLERAARASRRGIWGLATAVAPWEYRRARLAPSKQFPVFAVPADQNASIIANRRSRIYHLPSCPSYAKVSPQNREYFETEVEARARGFRKAKNCEW